MTTPRSARFTFHAAAVTLAGATGMLAFAGLLFPEAFPGPVRALAGTVFAISLVVAHRMDRSRSRRFTAALEDLEQALDGLERDDFTHRLECDDDAPTGPLVRGLNRVLSHLERGRTHWQAVIETAAEAILVIDSFGKIQSLNPAAEQMFGWDKKELLGENVSRLMPSPHAEDHDRHVRRYLETGETRVLGKSRAVTGMRRGGEMFPAQIAIAEMRIDGQVFFTGMIHDITRTKALETELREQAEALEIAHARALEATASKSAFLANMSHEIRTPMTAILGYVDLLGDDDTDETQRTQYLETVRTNGQHLLSLINDILDLSKVEAGKVEVEHLEVSLVAITREIRSALLPRAEDRDLSLEFTIEGDVPRTIETDPVRLRQILMNLIGNALKFTEQGGVDVRIRCGARGGRARLQFAVQDTGIGLDAEQIERLFHPFTQAEASTTRRFGGTGLGLTISRRLAQLLGGDIAVDSEPGLGSVFTLTIDPGHITGHETIRRLFESGSDPVEPAERPTESSLSGRVLVAEDNPVNQRLVQRMLEKMGLEVEIVPDGAAAVRTALEAREEARPFDVVLMDMMMPVMDGYEATRLLRESGYFEPIVALTANAMASDRERCLEAGCDEFLTKPIDRRALRRMIEVVSSTRAPV